jgi:long-chain acyl-CoA synthetase
MAEQTTQIDPVAAGAVERDLIAVVGELVRELHPQRAKFIDIAPSSRIERDLGIDSLGRTELILRIERAFRVRLPPQTIGEAETVDDLVQALQQAGPGLYLHDTAASNAAILGHSDARLLLLDTEGRWRSLAPLGTEFPFLQYVWIRDAGHDFLAQPFGPVPRRLANLLAEGSSPPPPHPAEAGDIATLIYTSGTTGPRKSVMLSHFALMWNASAPLEVIPPCQNDVFLSILPLAHAFARADDYYLPMIAGCTVAYARSPNELRQDLITIRPTVIFGVPVLFERMAAAIQKTVGRNFVKRSLLRFVAFLGWQLFQLSQRQGEIGRTGRALFALFKQLVAKRVLEAFGGRLRVAISGGAPLDPHVGRLLIGLGSPLVEGYGLTELGPVVAVNGLDGNLPGSVGRPLRGVEVKLAPNGELLVRSPSMMTGYWKDEAQTAGVLSSDGWLSTGDLAEIKDGRIFICGRLQHVIVLSIGEKINPAVVEAEIARDPLIEQVLVIGQSRPYLVALIVLNRPNWMQFAADNGIAPEEPNQPASKTAILTRLMSRLSSLPRYFRIRAVHLMLAPWTSEEGLLTPTLKVKRDAVQQKFAKEIEALYIER